MQLKKYQFACKNNTINKTCLKINLNNFLMKVIVCEPFFLHVVLLLAVLHCGEALMGNLL